MPTKTVCTRLCGCIMVLLLVISPMVSGTALSETPEPYLVKDIRTGDGESSYPHFLTPMGDSLYFVANDDVIGHELWKTDGTEEGTVLVKDIWPGEESSIDEEYLPVTELGDGLVFAANDGVLGRELWRSDGTEAGTELVTDFCPGACSGKPRLIGVIGDTIYFTAVDGSPGYPVWRSDGTAGGTVKLFVSTDSDFRAQAVGDIVYLVASDADHGRELWRSDGTPEGTALVKDIRPGSESSWPDYMSDVDGTLLFFADDGTHGHELWRSDGTAEGTDLVKDIVSGPGFSGWPGSFVFEGELYFGIDDGVHGRELWKSDGTEAGTVMLKDIIPGYQGSGPRFLDIVGPAFYFAATDGTLGDELWKSDGTTAGTVLVKDFNPEYVSIPHHLATVGDTLLFTADDGIHGRELWKTDGTAAGTVLVKDIYPGEGTSYPEEHLGTVDDEAYFIANVPGYGEELWKTDGSTTGTEMVKDINPGPARSDIDDRYAALLDKSLFFAADDGARGRELWVLPNQEVIDGLAAANSGPIRKSETVTLTAQISHGSHVKFSWDCGDGHGGEGQEIAHAYASAGVYTATVTAKNLMGQVTATTVIQVRPSDTYLPALVR